MKKNDFFFHIVTAAASFSFAFISGYFLPRFADTAVSPSRISFTNSFKYTDTLEEVGDPAESGNSFWWLDSGAYFFVADGVGYTFFGDMPRPSIWRKRYEQSNSADTGKGARPQNIFRLFTRIPFQNTRQEGYFRMFAYDRSSSPNRNTSNGFSLISRYRDSDNFYYGGIRVDGSAVIKKKIGGNYYELARAESFLPGRHATDAADLLFRKASIGVRLDTVNTESGHVMLKLSVRAERGNAWHEILVAIDNTSESGTIDSGLVGIRTDFMDAEIAQYQVIKHPNNPWFLLKTK